MKPYYVNIDFEYQVLAKKYNISFEGSKKFNKEFEYIFFFCEPNETLAHSFTYEEDYLEYLSTEFGLNPQFSRASNRAPWWGDLSEDNSPLNDKIFTTNLALEYSWAHPKTKIIKSFEPLEKYLKETPFPIITKTPYEVGGRGNKIIENNEKLIDILMLLKKKIERSPLIVEPLLNRVLDFSSRISDGKIFVQNISQKGSYQGGWVKGPLFQNFCAKNGIEMDGLMERIKEMRHILNQNCNSKNKFKSVDSFFYLNKEKQVKEYLLCEANIRKSMSVMLEALNSFGFSAPFQLWSILHHKNARTLEDISRLIGRLNLSSRELTRQISPPGLKHTSFLIGAESSERVLKIESEIKRKLNE